MIRDEEKTEVLNHFFTSVIISKTDCFWCTQPAELEDRDRMYNEAFVIQGEMVKDLLHHLDTHTQIYGSRWHLSKDAEGTSGCVL